MADKIHEQAEDWMEMISKVSGVSMEILRSKTKHLKLHNNAMDIECEECESCHTQPDLRKDVEVDQGANSNSLPIEFYEDHFFRLWSELGAVFNAIIDNRKINLIDSCGALITLASSMASSNLPDNFPPGFSELVSRCNKVLNILCGEARELGLGNGERATFAAMLGGLVVMLIGVRTEILGTHRDGGYKNDK